MASASCTLFCSVSHFLPLLLISMLIQYSESCPPDHLFNFSCPDNVYNGPLSTSHFTSPSPQNHNCPDGPCELTCDNVRTMIKCTKSPYEDPPYRVLEINPTNLTITIVVDYTDGWMSKRFPPDVFSDLKFNFPIFQSVSLSMTGSGENQNQTFLGCPFPSEGYDDYWDIKFSCLRDEPHNVIVYGPYEYGLPHGLPPPPAGCMKFQTTYYSPYVNNTKEPASVPSSKRVIPWALILIPWALILSVIAVATAALIVIIIYWRRRSGKPGLRPLPSSIMSLVHARSDLEVGNINNGVAVFSYAELQEVTNDFDPARELGEGGFGVVYHGKLKDGREVAVKRMFEKNYRQIEQFKNEIQLLTNVRHPNLVTLYGSTSRHSRELLLVYEYIPNGTLSDHLHGRQSKSALLLWPARLNIAIQTASALCYLHFKDIIHRDIKSNNILLDKSFVAKVADFGLSRLFPSDVSHVSTAPQGTPGYLDPEYHQCYHLTDRSDVYSFGVVLVELISSREAVDFEREGHEVNLANYAMNRIQGCEFGELVDVNLGYDKSFKVRRMTNLVAELAFRCLQHEREIRPSMEEVLEELKRIESVDYEDLEAEEMG